MTTFERFTQNLKEKTNNLYIKDIEQDPQSRIDPLSYYKETFVVIDGKTLNANWVKMPEGTFIASQAPIVKTQCLFWKVCLEYSNLVVDLTCNFDSIDPYYPTARKTELSMDSLYISLIDQKELIEGVYIQDILIKDENNNLEKYIKRMHCQQWLDMQHFQRVDELIKVSLKFMDESPPIIHCRAGVGRTGTFITALCMYKLLIKEKNLSKEDRLKALEERIMLGRKQRSYLFVESLSQQEKLFHFTLNQ